MRGSSARDPSVILPAVIASLVDDVATLLGDAAILVTAITGLIVAIRASRKVDQVHGEVKTLNSRSLANLADAAELRRIAAIPEEQRTVSEKAWLVLALGQPEQ
jgi:hypothetical protein